MKHLILFILLTTLNCVSRAQNVWTSYYDTVSNLVGFKDHNGIIMIAPKFNQVSGDFKNIIAVTETTGSTGRIYYLLKNGTEVGRDSVDTFEAMLPCESEGKIIFVDRKKDARGVLDENGKVIIPAVYNFIVPFKNGIAVAHRNAKRVCADGSENLSLCEHASWSGGENVLINEKNEILAEGVSVDLNHLNWYSLQTNLQQPDTSLYVTIAGKNNITYSFIDFKKEFQKWFSSKFLPGIQKVSLSDSLLFQEITFWDNGWRSLSVDDFLKIYPKAVSPDRFITSKFAKLSIGSDDLNPFIYEQAIYRKYLNQCNESYNSRYPYFDVMITHFKKRLNPINEIEHDFHRYFEIDYQEHFGFLRTETGYRLLSVSLPK